MGGRLELSQVSDKKVVGLPGCIHVGRMQTKYDSTGKGRVKGHVKGQVNAPVPRIMGHPLFYLWHKAQGTIRGSSMFPLPSSFP